MTVKAPGSLKSSLSYEGWAMVVVGFVCVALAFGASTAAMPLMYDQVMSEFGWTRTQATMIFLYKNVASAFMALFVIAPMYMRFGLRPVMVGSLILTGLGMVSFLWIGSIGTYYGAGFVLGLGVASVLVSTKVLISRWFIRRQGLAIGIVLTGSNAGGIVFPILTDWLIDTVGWRMAFASLSLGIWAVALPLYFWKARNTPSPQDTREEALTDAAKPPPQTVPGLDSFRSLTRTPSFWVILVCIFMVGLVDTGVFQHTALFLERGVGVSGRVAAYSISAIFGLGILAKIAAGRFFDTWSIKGISFWYLLAGLAVAAALSIQGTLTLLLFVLLRGVSHGGVVSETPVLAQHCYGPGMMDLTLPVFAGTWAVGAALGPVALALTFDHTGNYQLGFAIFAVMCVVAAALLYRVRPLYRLGMMAEISRQTTAEPAPEPSLPSS